MTISSEGPGCFKARELTEGSGELVRMVEGMRDRGVDVDVLEHRGSEMRFCIN